MSEKNPFVFNGKEHFSLSGEVKLKNTKRDYPGVQQLAEDIFKQSKKKLHWYMTEEKEDGIPMFEAYIEKKSAHISNKINSKTNYRICSGDDCLMEKNSLSASKKLIELL